jgi:hypothetical protein
MEPEILQTKDYNISETFKVVSDFSWNEITDRYIENFPVYFCGFAICQQMNYIKDEKDYVKYRYWKPNIDIFKIIVKETNTHKEISVALTVKYYCTVGHMNKEIPFSEKQFDALLISAINSFSFSIFPVN